MAIQKCGNLGVYRIDDGHEDGEYFVDGKKGRFQTQLEAAATVSQFASLANRINSMENQSKVKIVKMINYSEDNGE